MSGRVIVIAGKDPTLIDGGSESYLRAYGRAAMRAGYEPHHFCVSVRDNTEETEFGYCTPRPFALSSLQRLDGRGTPALCCKLRRPFRRQKKSYQLVHSFGPWSGVGVAAAERLRQRKIQVTVVATPFGTYNHETRGKLRGLRAAGMSRIRWQCEWELFWTRMTVDRSEGRGYRGSDIVLVNYDFSPRDHSEPIWRRHNIRQDALCI